MNRDSETIKEIANDFYQCLSIPIKVYDSTFDELHSIGYSTYLRNHTDKLKVIEDVKKIKFVRLKDKYHKQLIYTEDIHYIAMAICENYSMGYFLIGPFTSKEDNISYFTYKPLRCIDNIVSFISDLCKNRIGYKPMHSYYIKKSIEYIHKNYRYDLTITDMCDQLGLNKSYFCSLFKKETGYTFTNFLNKVRIEKSKEYLSENSMSILDIAVSVGFNSQNYYTMAFKKFNNLTPNEYKKIQKIAISG